VTSFSISSAATRGTGPARQISRPKPSNAETTFSRASPMRCSAKSASTVAARSSSRQHGEGLGGLLVAFSPPPFAPFE
jgi:hypothetical protein